MASARIFPAWACSQADEKLSQAILIWPPTRSLHLLVRGAVSHASHLNTGGLHQHLATKVLARTVARCGVRLIWIRLNPGDELGEASCRDGGMHHKQVGLNRHQVEIGEVSVGVVAEVFLHD